MRKIGVIPVMVMLFLTLFIGVAPPAFGGTPLCRVGLSPWQQGRQINNATETEYRFRHYKEIVTLGKGGRPSGICVLDPEESTLVVPNGFNPEIDSSGLAPEDLPWISVCGNPIISKFSLSELVRVERPQAVQQKAVNLNYSPPQTQSQEQNLFVIMAPAVPATAERVEKKGTCWWCWALVLLAAIGVGAYVYSVSQNSNKASSPPPSSGGPVNPPIDTGGPVNPPIDTGGPANPQN